MLEDLKIFNPRTRKSILSAKEKTNLMNQSDINSGHLLYGVLQDPETLAYSALQNSKVNIQDMLSDLESSLENLPKSRLPTDISSSNCEFNFDEYSLGIIDDALRIARSSGSEYIGTEHLVAAMFLVNTSEINRQNVAYDVLKKHTRLEIFVQAVSQVVKDPEYKIIV